MRISLTGTPVENHLQELWSHFHFLIPSLFDSQDTFEASVQASQSDKRYLERIKKKIQPFLLRRRKQDVLQDLPSRIDQTILIEMENSQRNLYEQLLIQFKGGLLKKIELEGVKKHRMEILEALLRLRQVCCHPLLVSSLTTEEIPTSAKFEHVLQDLETIVEEGHKVLVYSQFTSMLKLFTKAANEKQWQYSYLDGQTADREKVVNTFQKTASQSIFFISLKAGGVGLNLTAADYVFLYDPWWNEAIEEQAISRAHRIGQKNTVITKRFVMAETIEEKMMQLKAAKRSLIFNILDSENTSLENLTMEDLQALFD
jgi:SNF2 family DNA or RNA helicase